MQNVLEQVRQVIKKSNPFNIIKGEDFVYFNIQPSQEAIVFQNILTKKPFDVISVYNYKDAIIGYLVVLKDKPLLDVSEEGDGIALFFDKKDDIGKPEMIFSDQKLRVLEFNSKSFFLSVKWRSNLVQEEI